MSAACRQLRLALLALHLPVAAPRARRIDGGVKRYYTGGAFEADGKPAPTVDSKEVCSLRESCKDGKPMPDPLAKEEEAKGGAADAVADELPDSTGARTRRGRVDVRCTDSHGGAWRGATS